jgi:hypothetical protein
MPLATGLAQILPRLTGLDLDLHSSMDIQSLALTLLGMQSDNQ